mmetsp:Transcript_128169/g.221399  ORF Transcript_128169/g.221399 Transcript_128169/m.221399 type:complete len:93 (+) Transcript_128169:824-1102(+)
MARGKYNDQYNYMGTASSRAGNGLVKPKWQALAEGRLMGPNDWQDWTEKKLAAGQQKISVAKNGLRKVVTANGSKNGWGSECGVHSHPPQHS